MASRWPQAVPTWPKMASKSAGEAQALPGDLWLHLCWSWGFLVASWPLSGLLGDLCSLDLPWNSFLGPHLVQSSTLAWMFLEGGSCGLALVGHSPIVHLQLQFYLEPCEWCDEAEGDFQKPRDGLCGFSKVSRLYVLSGVLAFLCPCEQNRTRERVCGWGGGCV